MKQKDIKVGHRYLGKVGPLTRRVTEISHDARPGTALVSGVKFTEDDSTAEHRLYLDTFAQWAHKEVKL